MNFPGRIIKINEADTAIVQAIATRLGTLGYVSGTFAGAFDSNFKSLVALFQSQHVDVMGRALKADGEIGPVTWAAIFGAGAPAAATGSLAQDALAFAGTQIGVMEQPVGSNKGPEVNAYLASVGVAPGNFWCMAFIHFCFMKAAKAAGMANTLPKTGSTPASTIIFVNCLVPVEKSGPPPPLPVNSTVPAVELKILPAPGFQS